MAKHNLETSLWDATLRAEIPSEDVGKLKAFYNIGPQTSVFVLIAVLRPQKL